MQGCWSERVLLELRSTCSGRPWSEHRPPYDHLSKDFGLAHGLDDDGNFYGSPTILVGCRIFLLERVKEAFRISDATLTEPRVIISQSLVKFSIVLQNWRDSSSPKAWEKARASLANVDDTLLLSLADLQDSMDTFVLEDADGILSVAMMTHAPWTVSGRFPSCVSPWGTLSTPPASDAATRAILSLLNLWRTSGWLAVLLRWTMSLLRQATSWTVACLRRLGSFARASTCSGVNAGRGGRVGTEVLAAPCFCCALKAAAERSSAVFKAAGAGLAGLGLGSVAAGAEVGLYGAFLLGSAVTGTEGADLALSGGVLSLQVLLSRSEIQEQKLDAWIRLQTPATQFVLARRSLQL